MTHLAIIGGTGFSDFSELSILRTENIETPYGLPSASIIIGELAGKEIAFLARHGEKHTIAPHKINYRANLWALKSIGVKNIIAIAAVGGINPAIPPKKIIIPDQIIDYTYSRKHTFFEEESDGVTHIDFTRPYCEELRQQLIDITKQQNIDVFKGGTYGATQGPRLETAAEIKRMDRDGCDIVGMTGMPEAALAKELGLCYATLALCVNWAAGITKSEITMEEIQQSIKEGMISINQALLRFIKTM